MSRLLGWRFVAVTVAIVTPAGSSAQSLVRGVVFDARTSIPLPGATVQVRDTDRGVVTNLDGRFELPLFAFPTELQVRFIGYRSTVFALADPPAGPIEIGLEPDVVELGELVVTDESVAEGIMRRAIARKEAWQDSIGTAYAEAYSRFILMREFEPVRVEETISALWWMAGTGTREVVRARRTRPSRDETFRFSGPLPVPDLYDDTIELYGTRFVGPLHPDSPDVYLYSLFGRQVLDGRLVYEIAFVPAGRTSAAFTGYASVEDSTFDVLMISVRPAVDRSGPPPVTERVVRLEERYARVSGVMRPVGFLADGYVRFGLSGASYPTARFRQVVGFAGHAVQVPVPDSLMRSERRRRDAPDLSASGWLFDWIPGWVPPTEEEAEGLAKVSSAPPLAVVFRPEGLLRNYLAVSVVEGGASGEAGLDRPTRWIRPWGWYNRVDGWHIGLRPELPFGDEWTVRPRLGYAEARHGVPWGLEIERGGPHGPVAAVGVEEYTDVVGPDLWHSRFMSGLAVYAGWTDWYDYFSRRRGYLRTGWRSGIGRADLSFSAERHRSAPRSDFHEGWLRKNDQRDNPPIEDGNLVGITLDLSTGDARLPGTRGAAYAGTSVEVTKAGTLGSDFGFIRWSGAVSFRIPTIRSRRRIPASFRLDLYFGLADDGTPVQLQGFLHRPVGPLSPGAGFRASDVRVPLIRQWVAGFWQHDFGTLLTEWLGIGRGSTGFGVFGGHAFSAEGASGGYHELGLFLSNLLGYPVRLNVGSSLDRFHLAGTLSVTLNG